MPLLQDEPNTPFTFKKFKKVKQPSYFYFMRDTQRHRLQLQVDLMKDFGNIVRLPEHPPCFVLNHPDYVKHVLLTAQPNYIKADHIFRAAIPFVGEGIITNNHTAWKTQRHHLAGLFQPKNLDPYLSVIPHYTQATLARWHTFKSKQHTFNLATEMMWLTLQISAKNFFSEEIIDPLMVDNITAFGRLLDRYLGKALFLLRFLPLPTTMALKKKQRELEHYLLSLIEKRKKEPHPPADLLTTLLQNDLTQSQLLGELKNLLVASYETTAYALIWTWYNLMTHPEALAHVKAELAHAPPQEGGTVAQWPYLRMVIDESLRLYPPTWILTRNAVECDEIDGHFIPAGAHILLCLYAIHRHPDYWENPELFLPERFSEENKKNIPRYSYLPFGAGPRTCIAAQLAPLKAQYILAHLLSHTTLTLAKQKIKPQAFLFLSIKNGLWVNAT